MRSCATQQPGEACGTHPFPVPCEALTGRAPCSRQLTNARKRVWAPLRRQAGLHVPSTAERMRLQAQQRLDIPDGGLLFSSPPPPAAGGLMGPGSAAAYTHLPLHAAPAAAASFGSPVIPPRFVGGGGYPHGGPTVYTHMTPTGAMMSPPSPWAATAPDAWMSLAMRPRLGVPPHAYGPPSIPLPLSAQSPMAHPQGYAGLRPGPIATGQWPAAAPVGMAGHVFHQQLHMQQQQQHLAHLQQQQQLQVQMIAQHQQQQMQMQQMQMLQQGGFPSRELPASHSGGAFSAPPMSSAFVAASTPLAAAAFMTPSSAGGIGAPFPTASGPWIGASRLGSPVVTASGSLVVSTGAPMVAWPAIASRGTIGTPVMPVSTQSYADTSTPSRVTPATSTPSVSEGSAVDVLAAMAAAAAAATSTSMTRSPPRVYSEASMTPISTVRSTESSLATAGTDMAGAGATPSMRTSNQSPSTSSAGRSEAVSVAGPSAMTAYVPASAQINAPAPTPAVVM